MAAAKTSMRQFTGIPASPGIATGKVYLHVENDFPEIKKIRLAETEINAEIERLLLALDSAKEELLLLQKNAGMVLDREQTDIFKAHLLMLNDPDFVEVITDKMKNLRANPEWAVWETKRELTDKLLQSNEAFLRERAADITDISKRVVYHLCHVKRFTMENLTGNAILAAHDLLPSDMLSMKKGNVKGIMLDMGSNTSHTAILARAFNIPAVLGLSGITAEIKNNDEVIIDGDKGIVIVNPDTNTLNKYKKIKSSSKKKKVDDMQILELPAETTDGNRVVIKANIGIPEETSHALRYKAEGIGLYRSEFLFIRAGILPGEDAQLNAYNSVLEAMGNYPVTIRTFDLGGDKIIHDSKQKTDANPLLGNRGIRISLSEPDIFKTQLRAILRAGAKGNVKIMFPLISGVEELEQALALLKEARSECKKKKQAIPESIETGIMIEVPSAAIIAGILAKKSAFLSIGTNDLIQYTLAADRGNEQVKHLAQPGHPAVVRLLKSIIDAAHKEKIKATMCGEMAGDPAYTPLLLGLGLDEFSMNAASIPAVKKIIRRVSMDACRQLANEILKSSTSMENTILLKNWMAEFNP